MSRNWEPVRTYREEGKSAHVEAISKRPAFRQLLDDASRDIFDIVVVHTLDRWSRNQRVMLESMSVLAKCNVSLVSITENIDYSTPQGKLFTQMLGSFAEYFSVPWLHTSARASTSGRERENTPAASPSAMSPAGLMVKRAKDCFDVIQNTPAVSISITWKARPSPSYSSVTPQALLP